MSAGTYTLCFVLFSAVGTAGLFLLLLAQRWLPGAPADRYLTTPLTVDLAANTAISFSTTTTWQAYGGETTLRYLTQMLGLVSQNFLAGASVSPWGLLSSEASPGNVRAHWGTSGWTWSALFFGSWCRWLWWAASFWSGRACRSTWRTTPKPIPWRGEFRPSPKVR